MKNKTITRLLTVVLAFSMLFSTTGCGKKGGDIDTPPVSSSTTTAGSETDGDTSVKVSSNNGINFISNLKVDYGFSASTLDEDYAKPEYNLEQTHVFEFDCSEEAGYHSYEAFEVYDNTDFENKYNMSYAKVTYDNGKITVAPGTVLEAQATGSKQVENGTWGSMNKLYLVQYIDLETGEKLEKPIVTPFSIKHDLTTPTLQQTINEEHNYTLKWDAVPGATKYRVYEFSGNVWYEFQAETTETSISVTEFESQKKSNEYEQLFENDLENAGYEVDRSGVTHMNTGAKYHDELTDGYFVVVAFDDSGKASGFSNICDVRDVANRLPYIIEDNVVELNIESVYDIPTYVNVEMIDGSTQQMLINYHGAQTYVYPDDEYKMAIKAKVVNANFDNFLIVLHGMTYDDIMKDVKQITERQDSLMITGGAEETQFVAPQSPSNEKTETDNIVENNPDGFNVEHTGDDTNIITDTPSEPSEPVETTEKNPNLVYLTDGYTTVDYMVAEANAVSEILSQFDQDKLDGVSFATSELEAWIASCLIARAEVIYVPVAVFPEAANTEYLFAVLSEAYRQNPFCGVLADAGFSFDHEALVVKWADNGEDRLNKIEIELAKAYEVANTVTNDSMTDFEKVVALNNYFCENASYDFDSMATDVDMNNLSQPFIDAHTPYGILCNNYGVCESYSEAFIMAGRASGLKVLAETGYLQGGAHEWNRVYVDGSWCVLDITTNDSMNQYAFNILLNTTDSQASSFLAPDGSCFLNQGSFSATDETKEYYYKMGYVADNTDKAIEILAKQLSNSDNAAIRCNFTIDENSVTSILKGLINAEPNKDWNKIMYNAMDNIFFIYKAE